MADVGETRILLPEGGSIKPGATGSSTHDGGKQTFIIADESHLYNVPRLKATYHTLKRNLSKRMGDAEPWVLETTTMYVRREQYRRGDLQARSGYSRGSHQDPKLLFDHRYSPLNIEGPG